MTRPLNLPPHLERILSLARWAPSGDNMQPWRFEVRRQRSVTSVDRATALAQSLNRELIRLTAPRQVGNLFFLGRTGAGPAPRARSLRRPLAQLLVEPGAHRHHEA